MKIYAVTIFDFHKINQSTDRDDKAVFKKKKKKGKSMATSFR